MLPTGAWPPAPYPTDARYGHVTVEPAAPVTAASTGTWTLTYVAGIHGVDDAGGLRVMFHNNSDFGVPQFVDPAAPNYCSIACSTAAPCHVEAEYRPELGVRPFKRGMQLIVRDRALSPGDVLTITFGDRTGGSPGATMQTFAGRLHFNVLLDAYGTGIYVPVGVPPVIDVVAGAPQEVRVHAPSVVVAGEPFDAIVVVRDQWGNVVSRAAQPCRLDAPGTHTVPFQDPVSGLRGMSNPVRCHPADKAPPWRVLWGDLHAQTEETGGAGTLDEYFQYARECAALDFTGHQANDFHVSNAAWERITTKTQEYDAANQFVTFAGYEWSGNTPGGGDHNVHFKGGQKQTWTLHRSSHWEVLDTSDASTDRYPVTALYDAFRGRDDVMLIPHVGGRYANLRECFDESLMPLVEICSCWGVFEWFADDALRRGKVFGFSAASDDHTGRPGMSFAAPAQFATGGGLTAVLAADRSRESIWDALRARRTYATTGPRILLDVIARIGGQEYPMGAAVDAASNAVTFDVHVHGTAPLWRVELLRWPETLYRHPAVPPALPARRHRLRIGWTGARIRARRRLTRWDGTLTLDQGTLLTATGWGFDRPDHGIISSGAHALSWRSATAGDWDGVVVEAECPDDATLRFETGPSSFTFAPRDVASQPLEIDAGGVGQRIVVERDPGSSQPATASFTYQDQPLPPGRYPYVVRVTQQDGHIAWSSPIFIQTG